eukprot:SAG11_NODE_1156_length_5658_cov_10.848174_3_plen_68_part_00
MATQASRYGPAHAIPGWSKIDLFICNACSSSLVPWICTVYSNIDFCTIDHLLDIYKITRIFNTCRGT